jgi:predicted dehydrogenase
MDKLGVGVLGVGEMGRRHAENLRRLVPQARLVAIADVNHQRARQAAADLDVEHALPSLEAMLDRKDIRAIIIATPDKFHSSAVIEAARAGKDIFCEKPLALNIEEAEDAVRAAEAGVRTEIVGSKGSILIGTLRQHSATFLSSASGSFVIGDHFLTKFADAYLAEMRDFVDMVLKDRESTHSLSAPALREIAAASAMSFV